MSGKETGRNSFFVELERGTRRKKDRNRVSNEGLMRQKVRTFVDDTNARIISLYIDSNKESIKKPQKSIDVFTTQISTATIAGELPEGIILSGKPITHGKLCINMFSNDVKDMQNIIGSGYSTKQKKSNDLVRRVSNLVVEYTTKEGNQVSYEFSPVEYTSGFRNWECTVTEGGKMCTLGNSTRDPYLDFQFDENNFGDMQRDITTILTAFESRENLAQASSQ